MSFVVTLPQKRNIQRRDAVHYLSPREIEFFKGFSNKARGYMWFMERLAVKKAIRLYFEKKRHVTIPWNTIEISQDNTSTPSYKILSGRHLKYERDTSISFSHVGNIAIGGIITKSIDGSLGVHIEKIRRFRQSFLKAFLTKEEVGEVKRYKKPENRNKTATMFWSIKEAYLKYRIPKVHPKEIKIVRLRKDMYEVYECISSKCVLKAQAKSWVPQKGFVASEVYIK